MLNQVHKLVLMQKLMIKVINLKLVIMLNTKTFLHKITLQIDRRKFLLLKKVKNTVPWTYVTRDLNGRDIVEAFLKKNCKKQMKSSSDTQQSHHLGCHPIGINSSFNSFLSYLLLSNLGA